MILGGTRALSKAALVGLLLLLGFTLIAVAFDAHRSQEKGRLVQSLVRQYGLLLASPVPSQDLSQLSMPWPDDSLVLSRWLSNQISRNRTPIEIRAGLLKMQRSQPPLSPVMQTSLGRWHESLEKWSTESQNGVRLSREEALRKGRRRYLEARGYADVGRVFDASVLFYWAASWLTRAVEGQNSETEFSEILYLLGDIYMTLRHSLPEQIQPERLLYVCSDLYPSSIWASRANAVRQTGNR
jgi:hypothetical protein